MLTHITRQISIPNKKLLFTLQFRISLKKKRNKFANHRIVIRKGKFPVFRIELTLFYLSRYVKKCFNDELL